MNYFTTEDTEDTEVLYFYLLWSNTEFHVFIIVFIALFYLQKERKELCVLRVLCGEII